MQLDGNGRPAEKGIDAADWRLPDERFPSSAAEAAWARFWMVWCVVPGTKLSMRQAPSDVGRTARHPWCNRSLGVSMPRSAMCAVMASMSW